MSGVIPSQVNAISCNTNQPILDRKYTLKIKSFQKQWMFQLTTLTLTCISAKLGKRRPKYKFMTTVNYLLSKVITDRKIKEKMKFHFKQKLPKLFLKENSLCGKLIDREREK